MRSASSIDHSMALVMMATNFGSMRNPPFSARAILSKKNGNRFTNQDNSQVKATKSGHLKYLTNIRILTESSHVKPYFPQGQTSNTSTTSITNSGENGRSSTRRYNSSIGKGGSWGRTRWFSIPTLVMKGTASRRFGQTRRPTRKGRSPITSSSD